MNSTEVYEQARVTAYNNYQSSLNNINNKELSYLRGCIKRNEFDTECFRDIEESKMIEVGVGVDCEEFTVQVNVSIDIVRDDETDYFQTNITDLLIDGVINFKGEYIEIDTDTEQAIINKLK